MLTTYIEIEFLEKIRLLPDEDSSDDTTREISNSFRRFLKTGTDIEIMGSDAIKPDLLKDLTTGRKGTSIKHSDKKINIHNGQLSSKDKQNPYTLFFLQTMSDTEKKKIRSNNAFLFGFPDDYLEIWQDASMYDKTLNLPVRKNNPKGFNSWNMLSDYMLPFSDIVICDPYLLSDISLVQSNFYEILRILKELSPQRTFNLLVITYEGKGNKALDIKKEFDKIQNVIKEHKIPCKLGLVFTSQGHKEHDRNILFNYLKIFSGDTLNYFNSKGELKTAGTEIKFEPYVCRNNIETTKALIKDLKNIVENSKKKEGYVSNKLLD